MHKRDQQRRRTEAVWSGLVGACCLAVSSAANADVTLSYAQNNSDAQAFEIMVKPPRLRMNEASGMWMLYDGSIDTMFAVDPNRQSYTRINRERARMMGGMMGSVQSQMQDMMKNMTPEQRAMMEQAMGKQMMPSEPKNTEYKQTGETRKVNGTKCEVSQLLVNDQLKHEFCVARPGKVGVGDKEYAVMTQMFELMSELRDAAGDFFDREIPDPSKMNGVAIESRSSDGAHHSLKSVSDDSLQASQFELPPGYQEEAIPTAP